MSQLEVSKSNNTIQFYNYKIVSFIQFSKQMKKFFYIYFLYADSESQQLLSYTY